MSASTARIAAEKVLTRFGVSSAPVDVEGLAKAFGIRVVYDDLGPDVSALLVTREGASVIGVHESHAVTRQRFSIAHEIGHFVLRHQFQPGEHVHVDQGRFVSERSGRASAGLDPKEVEANQFAAALLMPARLVRMHAARFGRGPLLEDEITQLARQFQVSDQAMTIRLTSLGIA